ncbi:hypothetical protein [Methanococcus maripaludis]|uniref:Uncharacterized protein n=1 Tax=Methanococcus maripaludis (strain DSM 14266 / JCM 13030 / NBRC 101832 / S2 / LL) TaxID=267377 RepID=Q6LZX1_METMP|nr:hypothetical protein [Methanococcus maripaludis]CAF30058.1 hypothetical protein MMP0502 [Methanococcus maripaludis S2]
MKKFLVGFILFSMVVSVIPGAVVDDDTKCIWCTEWEPYGLYAGQNELVGNVSVRVCGDNLEYKYEITEPGWCISEIHLMALNESPNDTSSSWYTKYVTKKGNPKVGQFEINEEGLCVKEYSGTLNLGEFNPCTDKLYIAAHAVVCECECECIFTGCGYKAIDEAEGWVIDTSNYIEGSKGDNDPKRYNESHCLGPYDSQDKDYYTFTSLGQGGSIELYFENNICGDGDPCTPDLEIYETTWGHTSTWTESICVEAYYNGSYNELGCVTNTAGSKDIRNIFVNYIYNLPDCVCIEKIRINDTSYVNANYDYDIDAVKANYWCVPEYEYICNCTGECETAWGNGTSFPGNNWAMYFEYSNCMCD